MDILSLQKRRIIDQWLSNDHIMVHLDSRVKGVQVPENLCGNLALTLKLSRLFYGKIELSEIGIVSQLKFSGEYVECVLPWDSIWGVTSDTGEEKVWNVSLPEEFIAKIKDQEKKELEEKVIKIKQDKSDDLKSESPSPFLKRIK